MYTSEEQVKDDVEFMENYHPIVDKIYNQGGLTLVSKIFITWAQLLVTAINLHINESKIRKVKDDVMIAARKIVLGNATIFKCFKSSFPEAPEVGEDVYVRYHHEIFLKSIRSCAGTVFKFFQDRYLGHYSKHLNVEFRKTLQCAAKNSKHEMEPKVEK